jgi:hypothetical protein
LKLKDDWLRELNEGRVEGRVEGRRVEGRIE